MAVRLAFREKLLSIMDQKNHWGWRYIVGPNLTKSQLLIHFQQEYDTYVRDFPIFLARVLGRIPPSAEQLKREFAENIYEEQTGRLSAKISKNKSHPDLFLKMMKGLGYSQKSFTNIDLLPTSLAYRGYLDLVTLTYDWRLSAALLTLFVEGSVEDRARLQKSYRPTQSIQKKLASHSLHKHHGLRFSDMDLIRVHHAVEGSHRRSAWETVLSVIPRDLEEECVKVMENALALWLLFRDGVCLEMGIEPAEFRSLLQAQQKI